MKTFNFQSKQNREKHNQEVIERMKSGDTLQRYSAQSSWFPPRPVIKKDANALKLLYRDKRDRDVHSDIELVRKD